MAALFFQVALRLLRLDFEVFFFGAAMSVRSLKYVISFASVVHFCSREKWLSSLYVDLSGYGGLKRQRYKQR